MMGTLGSVENFPFEEPIIIKRHRLRRPTQSPRQAPLR
ncbi:MAG: hypothetical protein RL248_1383 [Pseudomonadota bacterium]